MESGEHPRVDRRQPERHRHTIWLLRRIAAVCLLVAVGLLVVPRLLVRYGLAGPPADEVVNAAGQAVQAARAYGAGPSVAAYAQAERELDEARRLLAEGQGHAARRAAERASAQAIEAQKVAIARSQDARRRALVALEELDQRIEELERLFDEVKPRLPREESSRLFSLMKNAREAAATQTVAFQDARYEEVLRQQQATLGVLEAVKERLLAGRP
jgi:fused signal recognition particle receptor